MSSATAVINLHRSARFASNNARSDGLMPVLRKLGGWLESQYLWRDRACYLAATGTGGINVCGDHSSACGNCPVRRAKLS